MTVIIYASCYQQNEGWTPSADPKENLFFHFAPQGLRFPSCLKFEEFVFFSDMSKDFVFILDRFEDLSFLWNRMDSSNFVSILRLIE